MFLSSLPMGCKPAWISRNHAESEAPPESWLGASLIVVTTLGGLNSANAAPLAPAEVPASAAPAASASDDDRFTGTHLYNAGGADLGAVLGLRVMAVFAQAHQGPCM